MGPVEAVPGGVRTADGAMLTHRDLKARYPRADHDPTANLVSLAVGLLSIPVGVSALATREDPDLQLALGATAGALYVGGTAGMLTFRLGRRKERVRLAQQEGALSSVRAVVAAPPPTEPAPRPREATAPAPPQACSLYTQRPGTLRGLPEADAAAVDRVCVLSIAMVGIEDLGPRTDDERAVALLSATGKLPELPATCRSALAAVQGAPAAMAAQMVSLDEACGPLIPGADGTMGPVQRWATDTWTPWVDKARPHLVPIEAERLDSFWPLSP